jgi:SAM-dependent methyltransferase
MSSVQPTPPDTPILRPDLMRVLPDDPAYREAAVAEAEFWSRPHPLGLETLETKQRFDGPVDRYTNERFTGDPAVPWETTIGRYGRFRRGLLLGTSMLSWEQRIIETNPDLHLTIIDLSLGALDRRVQVLGARYPGRIDTLALDMNMLALPADTYDVVISCASVHHVTNLEHLAWQINQALRPDGRFFLQDYVGEPRFQFADAKRRVFELLYAREAAKRPGRQAEVVWHGVDDLSPFCGVRSHEILHVFRTYLDEVTVRTAGTLTIPLLRARPTDGAWPNPRRFGRRLREAIEQRLLPRIGRLPPGRVPVADSFLAELMLVGDVLTDSSLLVPGNAFAVYRRRDGARRAEHAC